MTKTKRIGSFPLTILFWTYFSVVVLSISPINAEQSMTFNPVADAYVSSVEGESSSNFGGKRYLQVADSENPFTGQCLGFLKFDLSELSSDASVTSAELKLLTFYVTSTHTITVHYCSDDSWTEYGISYDTHPSFKPEISDSATVASTDKWYEWNVTWEVHTAVKDDKNLTLVLESDQHEESDWVQFHSRDYEPSWMKEHIPKLTVYYKVEGEPTDLTSTIIGGIILLVIVGGIGFGIYKLIKRRKPKADEKTPLRFCPKCGRRLKEDTLFCPYCGKRLPTKRTGGENPD